MVPVSLVVRLVNLEKKRIVFLFEESTIYLMADRTNSEKKLEFCVLSCFDESKKHVNRI